LKNLRILDAYINAGYEFCFLTARGCEDAVKYAIQTVIKHKDSEGILKDIKPYFNKVPPKHNICSGNKRRNPHR
jgi:4-hydroxy-3-methylbut-2-enyl diphosphate reductase IspH